MPKWKIIRKFYQKKILLTVDFVILNRKKDDWND
jgi:hypothetical protein